MAKQTKTETIELIPAQLSPVLKDTKIEISKAESHAMAFAPSMGQYLELAEIIKGLDKTNPTEIQAKQAREARLKMVKVRTSAEEIKDLRKEGIKAEGDLIQALYNVVKNSCIVTETEFAEIEKHQERVEAKRQSDLSDIRMAQLAVFGTDTTYLPLGIMTDDQFNRLLENETLAFNARKEQAEKIEAARIEQEKQDELARLEQERLQAERIEAERLEAIRIKQELAAKELQLANERAASVEKERLRVEAENKAKKDRELLNRRFEQMILKEISALGFTKCESGIENTELGYFIGSRHYDGFDTEADAIEWFKETKDRVRIMTEQAAIAKEQSDKQLLLDAELAAEKLKTQMLAEQLQAKKEAEAKILAEQKAAQLAPDKEKINTLYKSIQNFTIPEFASNEAKEIGKLVQGSLAAILTLIKNESTKLK